MAEIEYIYFCSNCGSMFETKRNLLLHIRLHGNLKEFSVVELNPTRRDSGIFG